MAPMTAVLRRQCWRRQQCDKKQGWEKEKARRQKKGERGSKIFILFFFFVRELFLPGASFTPFIAVTFPCDITPTEYHQLYVSP